MPRAQRLPLDEGHREVREPVRVAGGEQRHDVRMLQPRREGDLTPEPLERHVAGHLVRQHLDHDLAIERHVGRDEHARHPAAAELALEGVGAAQGRLEL